MTDDDYDWAADAFGCYGAYVRLMREKGLKEGRFTPINDEERRIAEGHDA